MEPRSRAVMPWLLLLCLAATGGVLQAVAQADLGFVSIDCGLPGEKGYVDDNTRLHYTTDAGFIDAGVNSNIVSFDYKGPSAGKTWNTVRSFPSGTRNCYTIGSLKSGLKYLIRGEFVYSNYDGLDRLPIMFDLYVGVNFWTTVNITDANSPVYAEAIVVVPDNFVQVCLVNTGLGAPFINGLDLRPLKKTLYPFVNETNGMVLIQRLNLGPSDPDTVIRYPADPYDRIWFNTLVKPYWAEIRTDKNVNNDGNPFEPPNAVMQTAITVLNPDPESWIILRLDFPTLPETNTLSCISIMHFSELNLLAGNDSRQFNIRVNGRRWHEPVTYEPVYLKSGVVYDVEPLEYIYFTGFLETGNTSTLPPLINAIEFFSVISTTNLSTDEQDASTITAIKKNYNVHKNWMGDPCFPTSLAWDGLNCSYPVSKHPIIRRVNLSFSGLNGVISPSFANMKNLQYLDLSNNNLTGSIPDELSQLPSLMFVDVSNNQLDGSIPSGLLKRSQDGSLVLSMPPRAARCRGRGRAPVRRGRGGRNGHVEELWVEVEQSHNEEAHGSQSVNRGGHDGQEIKLKDWISLNADDFHGTGTPMEAASWLNTMEKYMEALELSSRKRVLYVGLQLKGLAVAWWRGVRAAHVPIHGEPTWEFFVQQFTSRYYPESFKEEMFIALTHIPQQAPDLNLVILHNLVGQAHNIKQAAKRTISIYS